LAVYFNEPIIYN